PLGDLDAALAPLDRALPPRPRRPSPVSARALRLPPRSVLPRSDPVPRVLQRRHRSGDRRIAPDRLDRRDRQADPADQRVRGAAASAGRPRLQRAGLAVKKVDVAIVGSGQGGVPLAIDLAAAGRSVALFERGKLGGSCVNYGCTPSKSLLA